MCYLFTDFLDGLGTLFGVLRLPVDLAKINNVLFKVVNISDATLEATEQY